MKVLKKPHILFNDNWGKAPEIKKGISLSVQLSGLFLTESMAKLEELNII